MATATGTVTRTDLAPIATAWGGAGTLRSPGPLCFAG
jgi:hypothetical protein